MLLTYTKTTRLLGCADGNAKVTRVTAMLEIAGVLRYTLENSGDHQKSEVHS